MLARFLPMLFAAALAPAAATAQATGACSLVPGSDAEVDGMRMSLEATCDYDAAEFNRRVLSLLALRRGALSIETVERIFGLPRLVTAYDHTQEANYYLVLGSARSDPPWSAHFSLDESYGPTIPERPARFRGTLRPERIDPRLRGEMQLDIGWLDPRDVALGSPACLSLDLLTREGRRQRWRSETASAMVMDAGPRQSLSLRRDGMEVLVDVTRTPACIRQLDMSAAGNPPIREITAEESAALERRSGENIGDEAEARIMAEPALDESDRRARRAQARFMREAMIESYAGSPRATRMEEALNAMTTEELRALAGRAVVGHYWGAAREDCENAVAEDDPPAALVRRARARGLNEVETNALRVLCVAYVEGRRFGRRGAPPR
jgi:hypothetical protein